MNFADRTLLIFLTGCLASAVVVAHPDHEAADGATDVTAMAPQLGAVTITEIDEFLIIESKDLPEHETGEFPNRHNPNHISAQAFRFRVPLTPTKAPQVLPQEGYLFGVAMNGVPFDPGTAETWQGNRDWREEALVKGNSTRLGVDQSNAHVQPTGMYHYHGIPWGLVNELRKDNPKAGVDKPMLIGWAADGYPIYFQENIRSSWHLKTDERASPLAGPGGKPNGLYTRDFEFVEGSGDLDEQNGRVAKTDDYPEGTYQYYLTEDFPYVPRNFTGQPDTSFSKHMQGQPHGPGGPPGGRPGYGPPPPRPRSPGMH